MHELWVGWRRRRPLGRRWRVTIDVNAAPLMIARLNTLLPEKYPGQDVVFWVGGFDLGGGISVRRDGRWPIEVLLDGSRSFTYRPSARCIVTSLGVAVRIGMAK